MMMGRSLFRDERGFTTTSMVLSLLVTLSLLFTAAQVYRINSAAAEVQDVADVAALAAESQVAEFMLVARFCDAVVLSLSLAGLTVTGLGIAALCTPATATLSKGLIDAGKKLLEQRNAFAERSAQVLNRLQAALPYFSAACAARVAAANDASSAGAQYLAAAVLVPTKGEAIEAGKSGKSKELLDELDSQADEIRDKAKKAEEASQEANRARERAFRRDCGDNPSYCMYERAARLAGLSGRDNPLYASVDSWSFSVALNRAKKYYRQRLAAETVSGGSNEEQARAALRRRFYSYAANELSKAYVHESETSFEASFPQFPSSTAEMRRTSLYTEKVYPVTQTDDGYVMHAWVGCPEATSPVGFDSIQTMESCGYDTCPVCKFTAASMGKVAAASTSIQNGFEFHYEAVAEEAVVYQKARHDADVPKSEVKGKVGALFGKLVEAMKESAGMRISPKPPGRYGAIGFTVNVGSSSPAGAFGRGFVAATRSLGPRAAISSATLVDEGTDEGKTALNSALDTLRENGGFAVGAAGYALDAWSWCLKAYSDGQSLIDSGLRDGLGSLPLVGASGLGTWAADKLEKAVKDVGLQPAEIGALKPVIVNSAHVAAKGQGSGFSGLMAVKQTVVSHPMVSGDLFSSVLTEAELVALEQVDALGDEVQIASIELLGEGGPSIPVTIPIPAAVKERGVSAIEGVFARIRSQYASVTEVRIWE